MRLRTSFPRFQETFTFIVQFKDAKSESTTAKMYVGKYFTAKGEFDEVCYSSLIFISGMILDMSFVLFLGSIQERCSGSCTAVLEQEIRRNRIQPCFIQGGIRVNWRFSCKVELLNV